MDRSRGARSSLMLFMLAFCAALTTAGMADTARADDVDCSMCHSDLTAQKVVHAAVAMGCPSCHTGIAGAPEVPHKNTSAFPRGLSADQPDLCFGCHDQAKFTGASVHAAIGMGCTGCHDPHSSPNEKLLKAEGAGLCFTCHDQGKFDGKVVHAAIGMGCTGCHSPHASANDRLLIAAVPALCSNCHDAAPFSKKNVHPPVAGGLCLSCHAPHATDHAALLLKFPSELCLDCHDGVQKNPHAIAGITRSGHPLGLPVRNRDGELKKGVKPAKDPIRKDRPFSCASCHDPHSSDYFRLFRYAAKSAMQLCHLCHKM